MSLRRQLCVVFKKRRRIGHIVGIGGDIETGAELLPALLAAVVVAGLAAVMTLAAILWRLGFEMLVVVVFDVGRVGSHEAA
jgi:hypothetical protein